MIKNVKHLRWKIYQENTYSYSHSTFKFVNADFFYQSNTIFVRLVKDPKVLEYFINADIYKKQARKGSRTIRARRYFK